MCDACDDKLDAIGQGTIALINFAEATSLDGACCSFCGRRCAAALEVDLTYCPMTPEEIRAALAP